MMKDPHWTPSKGQRFLRPLVMALPLLMVGSAIVGGERPEHYFTGRVCKGKEKDKAVVERGSFPCKRPINGATVTIRNSRGQVISTHTSSDGSYTLDTIALLGTDDDSITYEARKRVALQIHGLRFESEAIPLGELGATILLPKERTEKMRSYVPHRPAEH